MENLEIQNKMRILALVTLFNPDESTIVYNISLYKGDIQKLMVWDNSDTNHEKWFKGDNSMLYHWTGKNTCIAPAINYAQKYANENKYDALLLMDQDSQWADFSFYRKEIERCYTENPNQVFTPYVAGNDTFIIHERQISRRIFINSGTVIPIHILNEIGGADETFPLDALDHDLSYRILKAGFKITCLTSCLLYHTIGAPKRGGILHLFTNDYGRFRTFSITRSHIICYRKHRKFMTAYEVRKFYKEIFMWKLIRIIFVEDDKFGRFKEFCRGIYDGLTYKQK